MKKCILFIGLSLILAMGHAQYALSFCGDMGDDGSPQLISNSFTSGKDGSTLNFYVKADEKFDTGYLDFVIYYIDTEGNEEEILKLVQKTEPAWDYVFKEVVFFTLGTYRVKVYNANGTYLTSANLSIKK